MWNLGWNPGWNPEWNFEWRMGSEWRRRMGWSFAGVGAGAEDYACLLAGSARATWHLTRGCRGSNWQLGEEDEEERLGRAGGGGAGLARSGSLA